MPKMCVSVVRQTVMNPADLELREILHAIDGVDDAIATLLASRRKLSRLAMLTKAKQGIPPFDGARESEIEGRYKQAAHGASMVARAIFRWCRGNRDEH